MPRFPNRHDKLDQHHEEPRGTKIQGGLHGRGKGIVDIELGFRIPMGQQGNYRVSSQDSTGSEYRALVSLPVESCDIILDSSNPPANAEQQ